MYLYFGHLQFYYLQVSSLYYIYIFEEEETNETKYRIVNLNKKLNKKEGHKN